MDVEDGDAVEAQSQFPRDSTEFRRSRIAFEAVTSWVDGREGKVTAISVQGEFFRAQMEEED
jgi:hypothetical protein